MIIADTCKTHSGRNAMRKDLEVEGRIEVNEKLKFLILLSEGEKGKKIMPP